MSGTMSGRGGARIQADLRAAQAQRAAMRAGEGRPSAEAVRDALDGADRRRAYHDAREAWDAVRATCVDCGMRQRDVIDRCLGCDVPVCDRCARSSRCAVCTQTGEQE